MATGSSVAGTISASTRRSCHRAGSLDGPIEVDTDAIARLARILVRQRKHERGHVPNGGASASRSNAGAAFWLAEVHHVQGQGKVRMVGGRVATQQIWDLAGEKEFEKNIH